MQGSIETQGYSPDQAIEGAVQEYGIAGWGRDMTNTMFDRDPVETDVFIYFILHN
jgi:hypothetical protein